MGVQASRMFLSRRYNEKEQEENLDAEHYY